MALVIGLREGNDFYVGDTRFVARLGEAIKGNFTLVRDDGTVFYICQEWSVELLPGVRITAGDGYQGGGVQAVFLAPRDILIRRGKRYREDKGVAA